MGCMPLSRDVKESDDDRQLEITSSQWLEADTGFLVTVSDTEVKPAVLSETEAEPAAQSAD